MLPCPKRKTDMEQTRNEMMPPDPVPIMRRRIHVSGIVQGVGFRPFVYRLARQFHLTGFVLNDQQGVLIEIQGDATQTQCFIEALKPQAPPLARVLSIVKQDIPTQPESDFSIHFSQRFGARQTLISPDIAVCDHCLAEMQDANDRRYRYPFINCTHCGPRFTIVHSLPYDRPNTSMAAFQMCPACQEEYDDPLNRRFHAQPVACPVCGPGLSLVDCQGQAIATENAMAMVWELLAEGKVIAIRGLGGFHLCVDPFHPAGLDALRRRKGRAEKPFALMAARLEVVKKYTLVDAEEEALLCSCARPIVLLQERGGHGFPQGVAPQQRYLGFMLPYTPLHHLLLSGPFEMLVMTSGNHSEEPIAVSNSEALERLRDLADAFLLHDREILQLCDDSIVRVMTGKSRLMRRARGYVPMPVLLKKRLPRAVLACGGELKNTIALGREDQVFISQHIGDLDNPRALELFHHHIGHWQTILEIEPEVIACDRHPDYFSSQWARSQKQKPLIEVQHHHAHLVAAMAENQVQAPCIGIILDGTGYGMDGTIWGGEVLSGDALGFQRHAWLMPVAMPGGNQAVRQPWRMALAYLHAARVDWQEVPGLQDRPAGEMEIVLKMIERRIHAPMTSSCGRLFDAVAALLGLCEEIHYEAQAAILLEMAATGQAAGPYPLEPASALGPLDANGLTRTIIDDLRAHTPIEMIAARFHGTLVELFVHSARAVRERNGLDRIVLSGGVYQNVLFFERMHQRLQEEHFQVITHTQVPCNDGGLALGQAVIAAHAVQT